MNFSAEPFIPHTLQHLTDVRAFPNPLPELAYNKMLADYAAVDDVTVQRITYQSDGLSVTGLMAVPMDIKPGAHQVLVYNRGGSREYGKLTVLSVMRNMVPFARAGYLVFASNYRGNDGGEGQEEFGGADIHDVLNLLDIAKSQPGYDGKNAFMIGHSRGGMMTLASVRAGAKVNAAISIAGIADAHRLNQSQAMVERIFRPLVPGYIDNPEAALSLRSPIDWAAEIDVPVLLLHGDNDKDVACEDSERLYRALQAAGKPSKLKIYPGGNHALIRVWDELLEDCFSWLESHTL